MPEIRHAVVPDIGDDQPIPLVEILVAVGDYIALNQGLITLESDKATLEIPATFSGRVTELLVKPNDRLSAGSPIAAIEVEEETPGEPLPVKVAVPTPSPVPAMPVAVREPAAPARPGIAAYASPLVYRLARELGVDLQRLTGSARQGRITRNDVMQHVRSALSAQPQATSTRAAALLPWPEVDFSRFGETERRPLT
ncbi:Dihydrolipoyllysine-residue acetyltransferase component of pyruvate dehydrogenase complex [Serratia plymuthica]|nr:Dihydrolipoyllysine-residue acetyltransferase component of pyruvate dehydrogenase complex [Serratia plymuthica]